MISFPVENGKTFSHVLGRQVKITPPMQRLLNALTVHGDVDTIRDGGTVNTVVALMNRGILREATPRSHGKGSGHHYPATTPEQVWDEADAEYTDREWIAAGGNLDTREDLDEGWGQPDGMLGTVEAESAQIAQDIHNGNYAIVMGEPIIPAEARTSVSDVRASIADEVAALRTYLHGLRETVPFEAAEQLARLDRIAALVPQRATDFSGERPAWQHDCGQVAYGLGVPPFCPTCRIEQTQASDWRALYTVAGR